MSTQPEYGVLFPTSVVGSMPRTDFVRELVASEASPQRRERALDAAVAYVVGMQEVLTDGTHSLAHDVAADLGYEAVFGEAKALPGGISFGNAALSRFPIVSQQTFPLPNANTDEARSVLSVELDTPSVWAAGLSERGHVVEGITEIGRINAIYCPAGLFADHEHCQYRSDRRGFGMAVGVGQ